MTKRPGRKQNNWLNIHGNKGEMDLIEQQKFVYNKYGAVFIQSPPELKIGISLQSLNVRL